jgi:hypothetical protein
LNPLNACASCGADFTSVRLFDAHRVGRHQPDERRCLSVDEMTTKGWGLDGRGRWSDPKNVRRARAAFAAAA